MMHKLCEVTLLFEGPMELKLVVSPPHVTVPFQCPARAEHVIAWLGVAGVEQRAAVFDSLLALGCGPVFAPAPVIEPAGGIFGELVGGEAQGEHERGAPGTCTSAAAENERLGRLVRSLEEMVRMFDEQRLEHLETLRRYRALIKCEQNTDEEALEVLVDVVRTASNQEDYLARAVRAEMKVEELMFDRGETNK